jgi:hypothetical protein
MVRSLSVTSTVPFYGGTKQAHLCGERKGERGALPTLMLLGQAHGQAYALEKVVERAIDGANDFFFGTIVGNGDAHAI